MGYTPSTEEQYRFKEGLCYFCGTNLHVGKVHLLPNQTLDGEPVDCTPPAEKDTIYKCYTCQREQVHMGEGVIMIVDLPLHQILTTDSNGIQWEWRVSKKDKVQ